MSAWKSASATNVSTASAFRALLGEPVTGRQRIVTVTGRALGQAVDTVAPESSPAETHRWPPRAAAVVVPVVGGCFVAGRESDGRAGRLTTLACHPLTAPRPLTDGFDRNGDRVARTTSGWVTREDDHDVEDRGQAQGERESPHRSDGEDEMTTDAIRLTALPVHTVRRALAHPRGTAERNDLPSRIRPDALGSLRRSCRLSYRYR